MILVDLASSSLQEVAHKYYCLPRTGHCHGGISVQLRFVMALFDMNSLGLIWSPRPGRCHRGRELEDVANQKKFPGPHCGFGSEEKKL